MDTGPELNKIYLITHGFLRGVRRKTGFLAWSWVIIFERRKMKHDAWNDR